MLLFAAALLVPTFWAPVNPPRAHYRIDVRYDEVAQRLEGTSTISVRNTTNKPIRRIALRWYGDVVELTANGKGVERVPGKHDHPLFDLPEALAPSTDIELNLRFGAPWRVDKTNVTSFLAPRLWWGFGTHDDYDVRIRFPEGYAIGPTGRYDAAADVWRAKDVRTFGLFVGKGHLVKEADAGGTRIRVVHSEAGKPCADLILHTAVDAVNYYRERFGMYPHDWLTIVPGADNPMGGYPVATGLVVVHGQEKLSQRPTDFWRWITAHEIGHQYFGEHTMARGESSLDWLMIGLGLHADREYRNARGIKPPVGALWTNYVGGVREGIDTTMDISDDRAEHLKWDFDNIVVHGKSHATLNALESVIGAPAFDAAFRRTLGEYKDSRLSPADFQKLCEAESGQDLEWFFHQWTRTPRNVHYKVAGNTIQRTGNLAMPVPVLLRLEDGTEQRTTTERLSSVMEFRAKEVVVDPDQTIAMAETPPDAERNIRTKIRDLPWTGAGDEALVLSRNAARQGISPAILGIKVALLLYDGKHYPEALELFGAIDNKFVRSVWRGHILDLLGRREEALAAYREAIGVPGEPQARHGQYKLEINKAWVEERLKTPFTRP